LAQKSTTYTALPYCRTHKGVQCLCDTLTTCATVEKYHTVTRHWEFISKPQFLMDKESKQWAQPIEQM